MTMMTVMGAAVGLIIQHHRAAAIAAISTVRIRIVIAMVGGYHAARHHEQSKCGDQQLTPGSDLQA
jgi:hypothetical protein